MMLPTEDLDDFDRALLQAIIGARCTCGRPDEPIEAHDPGCDNFADPPIPAEFVEGP